MGIEEKRYKFKRRMITVDGRLHLFVEPVSEKEQHSEDLGPSAKKRESDTDEHLKKRKPVSVSFFGHHIEKLLAPDKAAKEDLPSLEQQLESTLEAVRMKLQRATVSPTIEERRVSKEEEKHRRFVEERNADQEALFGDIVQYHDKFGTGLNLDDLWSLHDLMEKEASHEEACALGGAIHELFECNLLGFLRRKAGEHAWQRLEEGLARFQIPFPVPESMEQSDNPVQNEKIREERNASQRDKFLCMPAPMLADLILGNVPTWVYSYPQKSSYLWLSTIFQGVAAAIMANYIVKFLSVWERRSLEILDKIQQEFSEKIKEMQRQSESAQKVSEILSVSQEVQRMIREEIPDQIWKYVSSDLKLS
jgi:hypothetical protein